MREIYCLLHNDMADAEDCRKAFLALEDPGAIEACRSCLHHQVLVVGAPATPAPAEPPIRKNTAGPGLSVQGTLRRLAGYTGVNESTATYCYYSWKKTGRMPSGDKGQAIAAWLNARNLSMADIGACHPLDFGPLPEVTASSAREKRDETPATRPEPASPKITECCVLSRPGKAPIDIDEDGDPDAPAGDLDPIREAAHYGIAIPPLAAAPEEKPFEELLADMKRRLPLGAKILIEL